MELKSKKLNDIANRAKSIFSGVGNALDSQVFSNARIAVLNYIDTIKGASNPIVHMHINEKTFTFEVSFDVLYKKDGQIMQQKRFYVVDLAGDDLPTYLVSEVRSNKAADVKFSFEDLRLFFDEKGVKVDDTSSFDELLQTCKDNGVKAIKLLDRVFYTRVECFDSDNNEIGTLHIGIIKNVPLNVSQKLYPIGTAVYTLD